MTFSLNPLKSWLTANCCADIAQRRFPVKAFGVQKISLNDPLTPTLSREGERGFFIVMPDLVGHLDTRTEAGMIFITIAFIKEVGVENLNSLLGLFNYFNRQRHRRFC
ncbi:MAG: hypothetical protein IIB64_04180 [Proteobacteria bacterium]|nr:hypothetical protein [Pseudomonadota bacterium]